MGVLQRFERRLEDMVNRPFARAFKAEVQPVEIASALQRECDDRAAIVGPRPHHGAQRLHRRAGEHDHERLSVYAEALGAELAAMVSEHAEEQRYVVRRAGHASTFERDDDLRTGRFRVRSAAVAGADRQPSPPPASPAAAAPAPAVPWVEVGQRRRTRCARAVTRIGRGTDADLRIDDPGVSRHHAELRRSGRRRHASSTSARPTASSSTASGSSEARLRGRRADRSSAAPRWSSTTARDERR